MKGAYLGTTNTHGEGRLHIRDADFELTHEQKK